MLEASDDIVIAGRDRRHRRRKAGHRHRNRRRRDPAALPGNVVEVLVDNRKLHGRSVKEVAESVGDDARGVFLRALDANGT